MLLVGFTSNVVQAFMTLNCMECQVKDVKIGGIKVMEDNENIVVDTTENVVEQATEELVDGAEVTTEAGNADEKLYSETELNEKLNKLLADKIGGKLAQQERRLRKEYEEKYGRTETVLKAGLGVETIEQATDRLADFYKSKGINIPERNTYSEYDLDLLANAEANEIINSGYEDLVDEVNRLANKGLDNMTAREKLVFNKLANERTKQESIKELAAIGVKPEALENSEFKEFADNLNPNLTAKQNNEMYLKYRPKAKIEPAGSMKSTQMDKVKDSYSEDEISRMTLDDLDDPRVWEAVRKSMPGLD
jgi:hypothetical protein